MVSAQPTYTQCTWRCSKSKEQHHQQQQQQQKQHLADDWPLRASRKARSNNSGELACPSDIGYFPNMFNVPGGKLSAHIRNRTTIN